MITTRKPIGRLFVLANNQKGIIYKSSIENDIENLIDIIKIRVVENELDAVSENLLSKIFDLRFEVLEWLAINKKDFNEYFEIINKEVAQKCQVEEYSKLFNNIIDVLEIYENIVLPIVAEIGFNDLINNLLEHKPNYDTIKMLSYLPQSQIKFFKNWIDASLKLEFGLIVSDLVMTKQIKFTKSRINKELIEYLNNTICNLVLTQ